MCTQKVADDVYILFSEKNIFSAKVLYHIFIFISISSALFTLKGKAIGLPDDFLAMKEGSKGGGVIQVRFSIDSLWSEICIYFTQQTSASECILVTMLAARAQAIRILKQKHPFVEEGHLLSKLMAYCSKEAHSCVEKAAMISFVKLRILEPDSKCSLRGETLMKVINCSFNNVWKLLLVGVLVERVFIEYTIKLSKSEVN